MKLTNHSQANQKRRKIQISKTRDEKKRHYSKQQQNSEHHQSSLKMLILINWKNLEK